MSNAPSSAFLQNPVGIDYNILLVDDDIWFRRLIRALLSRTRYRILEARDGMDGIALLQDRSVDLLMTDIEMPRQGGLATIDAARSAFPDMRILAVSGTDAKEHHLRAAEMLGADATLPKPINKASLLETLSRLSHSRS